MAYNYVNQAFVRNVVSSSSYYYTGGNKLCGELKDFILANLPEATLESDNDPPLNGGEHTTVARSISIKIRGVRKIRIYSLSHATTNIYGGCYIQFVQDYTQLGSLFYFGTSPNPVIYLDGLFIDGVGYFFKDSQSHFGNVNGYILSDEDECIIIIEGSIFSLNNSYTYTILPTGYYNNYVNDKMILTELMLKKLDNSNQTLRFKNKKIFRPGISNYFSLDRFYIGDDGHKYAYIGTINMLVQLE